jgi:hypothetical protein
MFAKQSIKDHPHVKKRMKKERMMKKRRRKSLRIFFIKQ